METRRTIGKSDSVQLAVSSQGRAVGCASVVGCSACASKKGMSIRVRSLELLGSRLQHPLAQLGPCARAHAFP